MRKRSLSIFELIVVLVLQILIVVFVSYNLYSYCLIVFLAWVTLRFTFVVCLSRTKWKKMKESIHLIILGALSGLKMAFYLFILLFLIEGALFGELNMFSLKASYASFFIWPSLLFVFPTKVMKDMYDLIDRLPPQLMALHW